VTKADALERLLDLAHEGAAAGSGGW